MVAVDVVPVSEPNDSIQQWLSRRHLRRVPTTRPLEVT
jgi:hypothetical protein